MMAVVKHAIFNCFKIMALEPNTCFLDSSPPLLASQGEVTKIEEKEARRGIEDVQA